VLKSRRIYLPVLPSIFYTVDCGREFFVGQASDTRDAYLRHQQGTFEYFKHIVRLPFEGYSPHDYTGMSSAVVSNEMCVERFGTARRGSNCFPFKRDETDVWISEKLELYMKVHCRVLLPETYIPFHFARGILAEELRIPVNWSKFAAVRWEEQELRRQKPRKGKHRRQYRQAL
jgi:hypothetical protein